MSQHQHFWRTTTAVLLNVSLLVGASGAMAAEVQLGSSGIDKRAPMCYRTGIRSYHDGDLKSARQWLSQAAALGHADAMYRLAHMYMSAEAGERNLSQAANLLKAAAESGHTAAARDYQVVQLKRAEPDSELALPQASIPAISPAQRPERAVAQPLPGMPPVVRHPAERPKPLVIEPASPRVPASERPVQIELPRGGSGAPASKPNNQLPESPNAQAPNGREQSLPDGMAVEADEP